MLLQPVLEGWTARSEGIQPSVWVPAGSGSPPCSVATTQANALSALMWWPVAINSGLQRALLRHTHPPVPLYLPAGPASGGNIQLCKLATQPLLVTPMAYGWHIDQQAEMAGHPQTARVRDAVTIDEDQGGILPQLLPGG